MQPPQPETHPSPRPPAGFTLIEVLVTISIITLLLGLTIVGGAQLYNQAKVERTRVLLQQLAGVETEYRAQSNGLYPDDDPTANTYGSTGTPEYNDTTIARFIEQIDRLPVTKEMAEATLNRDLFTPPLGTPNPAAGYVLDPWGTPVEYRVSSDGQTAAVNTADGTAMVFPLHSSPFFASAGPDGQWGSYGTSGGVVQPSEPDEEAADNVYSFEMQ